MNNKDRKAIKKLYKENQILIKQIDYLVEENYKLKKELEEYN